VLDLAAKTGSADVVIDATSVNTGHTLLNEKIQDKDFFDSARYPAITFKSGKMTLDGEQPSLAGDLTIKGVTRPVTLAITQFKCESDPLSRWTPAVPRQASRSSDRISIWASSPSSSATTSP